MNQMLKKITALLLAVAMLMSMAACGKTAQPAETQPQMEVPYQQEEFIPVQTEAQNEPAAQETAAPTEAPPAETEGSKVVQTGSGNQNKDQNKNQNQSSSNVQPPKVEEDRESLEEIADLVKDVVPGAGSSLTDDVVSKLDDVSLSELITSLLENTGKVPAGDPAPDVTPDEDAPNMDMEEKEEFYDENGAMEIPFDQMYPDVVAQEQVKFDDRTLLIKMHNSYGGAISAGMKAAGVAALDPIVPMETATWYEAKLLMGTNIAEAVEALRALREIMMVDYNYQVETSAMAEYEALPEGWLDNTQVTEQWYLNYCGIPSGTGEMTVPGGSSSVVVAVIDTGVDYNHEDLADNIWVNTGETPDNGIDDDGNGYIDDYYGVDIVAGKGSGNDDNGHGTHVAGIIAAKNNNMGVVGIAHNVKIMPVKAAMASGYLNQSDIAKAILYAYEHGAEVINMSFGGSACSIAVQDALAVAYTRCVLVASAGNDGMPNEKRNPSIPNYPAALSYVLGVMSVNQAGRESGFSNWDAELYSPYEYELYAPGEGILSTIPGNRYASWSGTSMAAPVAAAMAALLRSEYSDRDTYPTKFIYGQLVATSEDQASCVSPQIHGPHNLPPIVNLHRALTVMPKPDVGLQDYALFDTEGMEQDAAGVNSGDGVIDAGETIALGLTLRNRWGKSENTIVKIDTLTPGGMTDPYITIHNPEVNYDSVGTYSTGNCGAIYTDGLLTGWENPFYITISEDCPNDYIFRLNVTVTCGNGLDEDDTAQYVNAGEILLEVRNGTVLPSIIEEDMVLTADNLYIIPNATVIQEGVTVRVEPGTHIQFWSNDRDDPYAEDYIAYLRVEGKFLVNGTKDNPVYIYPSDLMSSYVVDFGTANKGVVELRYADVTNYNLAYAASGVEGITYAFGCIFRQNYGGYMSRRYLNGGNVKTDNSVGARDFGTMTLVEDSVFYKCGSYRSRAELEGAAVRCLFVDSAFDFMDGGSSFGVSVDLRDCVFQGNYFWDQTAPEYKINTTHELGTTAIMFYSSVVYNPVSGSIYVEGPGATLSNLLEKYYGATYAIFETEEELTAAYDAGLSKDYLDAGISFDEETQTYLWSDGTPVGDFLLPLGKEGTHKPVINNGKLTTYVNSYTYARTLLEVPTIPVPDEITFPAYEILMNTQETFQLAPVCAPMDLPTEVLLYESSDETVLTVSESGLLTPVGTGVADVYVYSADKAVYNYVTVTVEEYVALEKMELVAPELSLEIGTVAAIDCLMIPANTTSRNVTWSSSDSAVATVDHNGNVTAVGLGTATITVSCSGVSASTEVTVWKKTETVSIEGIATTASVAGGTVDLPEVTVTENSNVVLSWESTDPEVAVIEGGKLVPKKEGTTTVRVTDLRTGLYDQILYYISESDMPVVQKIMTTGYNATYSVHVLYEDGVLYGWSNYITQYNSIAGIRDFTVYRGGADTGFAAMAIREDNTIVRVSLNSSGEMTVSDRVYTEFIDRNPVKIYSNDDTGCFVLLEDGTVYTNTEGNDYGQAGVGYTGKIDGWAKVLIEEPIRKMGTSYSEVLFLAESGNLYAAGGYYLNAATPVLIARNVSDVNGTKFISDGCYGYMANDGAVLTEVPWDYEIWHESANMGGTYALRDDVIYRLSYGDGSNPSVAVEGLEGITDFGIFQANAMPANFYVATSDGLIYHLYDGDLKVLALRPLSNDTMKLTKTNLDGTYLKKDTLELTFSNVLTNASVSLYEDGILIGSQFTLDENRLGISCGLGFADGKTYRVVIASDGLASDSGATLAENVELSFTYVKSEEPAADCSIAVDLLDFTLENRIEELPPVYISEENAPVDLVWQSSDPAVVEVIGDKLLIKRLGTTSLTVTDRISGISSSIPVFVMEDGVAEDTLNLVGTNLSYSLLYAGQLELAFDKVPHSAGLVLYKNGEEIEVQTVINGTNVYVTPVEGYEIGALYRLVAEENGFFGIGSEFFENGFELSYLCSSNEEKEPVVRESQRDSNVERLHENFIEKVKALQEELQYGHAFAGNAILNRISTDSDVSHWFRLVAYENNTYEIPLGTNWWGTTNETAIKMQMVDYTDFNTYGRFLYSPYLTTPPENVFPFITDVSIFNAYGEKVTEVSNEEITVRVTFNRDMDTSIPLTVRFGSAYPYGDYELEGSYVSPRVWEGVYTLTTLIENGNQLFSIADGCSATEDLDFFTDWGRFGFVIDTTAAQALIMQGTATDTGIQLTWTQDDFDTLMGYNVYRATSEDGFYQRLNSTVIPAETMEFFDDTVEPGVVYYYNFTVVQTDLSESIPSGKISIMSKDTMAPNLYHSPVYNAFTGSNLVISATVTDNLSVSTAKVFYRTVGQTEWKTAIMNKLNDKYSAIIPADQITTEGLEYYIEATDGINVTRKGSAEAPYVINVQQAVDASSRGDVDGNGRISNLDALMLLQAINDLLNLTAEQFARADLNGDGELTAAEALRILHYVSGKVGDLNMP